MSRKLEIFKTKIGRVDTRMVVRYLLQDISFLYSAICCWNPVQI
jgi:hypothetical protein